MKKLLISSLKFFCLSAMKFFLLRFNNFTQFLYTSSVIISREFVFLNLRLTFGEDLVFLSVQKSSNLCVSNVQLLTICHNGSPCSLHNGSPRSFGHGRRRLTDRQAFSLGVIDMYSVCVMKHILECGVIVLHVLEEPLLKELRVGQGLCVGLDISLHEVVVLGLITCEEVGVVKRHHFLSGEVRRVATAHYLVFKTVCIRGTCCCVTTGTAATSSMCCSCGILTGLVAWLSEGPVAVSQ